MVAAMLAMRMHTNHHSGSSTCRNVLPAMEDKDMNKGGSKRCKANSISHGEESAEIERPFAVVSGNIECEFVSDDARDIEILTVRCEETIGKYREGLGLVHIEPVSDRCQDIHDKDKSHCNVGCGKPWARKWAPKVRRDGGPIEPNGSNPQSIEP